MSPSFITAMPQHLPPEILREIFTHPDNKCDLSSLCEVFRSFKEIAQPLLFRKFTLMDYSDESQTEVFRALTQFTRTVLSRTDLQCAVREINIRTGEGPDADPAYEMRTLLFDTRICLPNELQKLRISEGANLMHARVILAAMTAPVMLLLCIKLKRLEVLNVIRVIWMYLSTSPISHRLLSGPFPKVKNIQVAYKLKSYGPFCNSRVCNTSKSSIALATIHSSPSLVFSRTQ